MTLAAHVASLVVAAVSVVWSVRRVRAAHREASQAAEVAVSSLLFAVAACEDAARSRRSLDALARRALELEHEISDLNRPYFERGEEVPDENAMAACHVLRHRVNIDEARGI